MAASISQLQKLGYIFIESTNPTDRGVFIYRPAGYGRVAALERLRKETVASLQSKGITPVQYDKSKMDQVSSLPGFGYSSDVDTVEKAADSASSTVEAIRTALSVQEGNKINVGNDENTTRSALEDIIDEKVSFSQAALNAQNAAGEEAARAKDAAIASEQPQTRAQKNAARIAASGKVPTDVFETGQGKFFVLNSLTGERMNDEDFSTRAQALAFSQQLSGGSTPGIADFPEIYATAPTQAEIDAGIQPIVSSRGEIVIPAVASNPELAQKVERTSEDLTANKEFVNSVFQAYHGRDATQEELDKYVGGNTGDIKNEIKIGVPINAQIKQQVESVYGDVTTLTVEDIPRIAAENVVPATAESKFPGMFDGGTDGGDDTEGLTDEEVAAAEELSDAVADSDLVYKPKLSPDDITKYISEGIESARKENELFFSEVLGRAKEAYIQGIDIETRYRNLQLRQEKLQREQEFKAAQSSLEERGATFSGEAVELLGEESALPENIRSRVQGLLQEQQGIMASSSSMQYQDRLAELTRQAEEQLGTQATSALLAQYPSLAEGLMRFNTPTAGSLPRTIEATAQTRGREIAKGTILTELAQSSDFPSEELVNYI